LDCLEGNKSSSKPAKNEKVRVFARENQTQLFQAAISMTSTLPVRAANALTGFTQLIERMQDDTKHLDLGNTISTIFYKA
jgi:DNA helicase-2/ATP-dependent DNA helicase PcrA